VIRDVSITNMPQKPFETEYDPAFEIRYTSEDSLLKCIYFEVQEKVIRRSKKITLVNDPANNRHLIRGPPANLPRQGSVEYTICARLGKAKKVCSEPVVLCDTRPVRNPA
jgi:hypothetical protein